MEKQPSSRSTSIGNPQTPSFTSSYTGTKFTTLGVPSMIIDSLKETPVLRQIVASATGSLTAVLCLNPISVLKVNIQNSASEISIREITERIYTTRGIAGFWGGAKMGLVQALPSTVIYMTSYEKLKAELTNVWLGSGIAGAMARFVSVSIISPLELIRTIQTGGSKQSALQLMKGIYSNEGVRGFYRGWGSSIMRDCPFSALYWFSFESLHPVYNTAYANCLGNISSFNTNEASYSHLVTFLSGATSGVLAALFTHPFDVIKTQQQLAKHVARPISVQGVAGICKGICGKVNCPGDKTPHVEVKHSHDCKNVVVDHNKVVAVNRAQIGVWTLYRTDGFGALFRGLSMRLATVIPASAIMVTVYKGINELVTSSTTDPE